MPASRILIVDDEPEILNLFEVLLAARGWEVECVATADQALPRLLEGDYDLVMCDVKLPGTDGRTLYQQVLAQRPEMAGRFLICTGDTVSPDTAEFVRKNHLPLLTKPFRLQELLNAILPFRRPWALDNGH